MYTIIYPRRIGTSEIDLSSPTTSVSMEMPTSEYFHGRVLVPKHHICELEVGYPVCAAIYLKQQ